VRGTLPSSYGRWILDVDFVVGFNHPSAALIDLPFERITNQSCDGPGCKLCFEIMNQNWICS
jgi:hypothetical protein